MKSLFQVFIHLLKNYHHEVIIGFGVLYLIRHGDTAVSYETFNVDLNGCFHFYSGTFTFIEALHAFMISVFAFYSLTLIFYDINVFILLIMSIFELCSLQFLIAVFCI